MSGADDDVVRAAGGVVWRGAATGLEIALVHRPRYDDWSLPKGKLEPGEHVLAAACREVVEETGLQPRVGVRLPSTSYAVPAHGGGYLPKTVDYWAMRYAGGEFARNDEVDGLGWFAPVDAAARVTHAHDAGVIEAFARLPEVTGVVILVRHAKAGSPARWTGADRDRPLEATGQAQAVWLAELLPWFGPRRVLSAAKVRCEQTVEPLAAGLGYEIEIDPRFDEETHDGSPDVVRDRIRELAVETPVTVVCSQGGLIPATVAELADADGAEVDRDPAAHRDGALRSRKGSAWVLSFAGKRLVQADYLPTLRPAR